MAFPKKGTRKITINGEVFHWRLRKPLCEEALIQHSSNGRILEVYFVYCYMAEPLSITPALIKGLIESAINRGWNYSEKDSIFKYEYLVPYTDLYNKKQVESTAETV